jgi:mttA/Hcf106 family
MQVPQAFFGVGAPEALLVGVVSLVVFGPKGLVDVRSGTLLLRLNMPELNL